jgi:hypothetical protein
MNGTISNISINGTLLDQELLLDLEEYISIVGEIDIIQDISSDTFTTIFGEVTNPTIAGLVSSNIDMSGEIRTFSIISGSVTRTVTLNGYIPIVSLFGNPKVIVTVFGKIDTKSTDVVLGYWLLDFSDSINSFYIVVI